MLAIILPILLLLWAPIPSLAAGMSETGSKTFEAFTIEEIGQVARGEPVIRSVTDPARLLLAIPSSRVDAIRMRIDSLRPNYCTEFFLVSPVKKGEEPLERLAGVLVDVEEYVRIPYLSKRAQQVFNLFDRVDIVSTASQRNGTDIDVIQRMNPFEDFKARYSFRMLGGRGSSESAVWYFSENSSPIVYQGVQAVDPGKMICFLSASVWNGAIVYYGVGMLQAWDLFGIIRDRLEIAFRGREESFLGYMSEQLR
jgi:hypothetical protein